MKSRSMQTLTRFWGKMRNTDSPSACWEWTRGKGGQGYAAKKVRQTMTRPHRIAWEIANGTPIPAGLFVCHECDNRLCCNPAHLFLGTQLDNMRDMREKGRAWNPLARANKAKTHCAHGHEFTADNTWVEKNGYRHCQTCARASRRDRTAREAKARRTA